MKWFGESWNAPVCDPENKVETPVGDTCMHCADGIEATNQGVMMPFWDGVAHRMVSYHRLCLLQNMGLSLTVHILDRGLPLCGFSSKVPGEWPHLHVWARMETYYEANCGRCKLAFAKRARS